MRILIAEIHRGSREGLAALLLEEGYDVDATGSAATALRIARQRPPDVLIADYDLRDMTSAELATRVRELAPSCRVIAVTGWAKLDAAPGRRALRDAIAAPSLASFTKPIDPDALLGALASA